MDHECVDGSCPEPSGHFPVTAVINKKKEEWKDFEEGFLDVHQICYKNF